MENNKGIITRSFRAAFPCTIPILAGFLFLGMAYGIYMNVSGFSFVYPMIMAAVMAITLVITMMAVTAAERMIPLTRLIIIDPSPESDCFRQRNIVTKNPLGQVPRGFFYAFNNIFNNILIMLL